MSKEPCFLCPDAVDGRFRACGAGACGRSRELPRALVIALPLVICVYVAANVAYLAVMPVRALVDYETGVPDRPDGAA